MKKVFSFDLGKASIGYAVREGHEIKEANSVIIEKDHSETDTNKARRRILRTLTSHKKREEYFNKLWLDCGLEIPSKTLITKEFPKQNEETLYTSCLLRIALLQNQKLEEWQIYKALLNSFQRRGYDAQLPWKTAQTDEDKESMELAKKYTQENDIELIQDEKYKYPCYYDAKRLNLWDENRSSEFKKFVGAENTKVRTTQYTTPRSLVEKELITLFENAQKQLKSLEKYSTEEFLYGEYKEAYGSYKNPCFRRYLGSENDYQGVLGQKIPRFNNRIISKCKLLPKRNVCKADCIENVSFVLLMKLKNLRMTDIFGEKFMLSPSEITAIFENWKNKSEEKEKFDVTITKKDIENVSGRKILDKIEPLKAQLSGRSSFCRRACLIMAKIIMSGANPTELKIDEFIDSATSPDPITEEEIREMLSKVGDWNNLYIPDNRYEIPEDIDEAFYKTDLLIGDITNPIVRNRLQIFRNLLSKLTFKYGKPDEVIFEFIRDDNSLFGSKKVQNTIKMIRDNEKTNENIKKELQDANALSAINFEKSKLLKLQGGKSIYSGKNISTSNFDECEIDHIFPRTQGGCDSIYNKVLCYREENQEKAGRTPYSWFHFDEERWSLYINRLNGIKDQLGKKKFELLTSPDDVCAQLIESYNGLAETSHIARVAQSITATLFNWHLGGKDESRHIFVNNGTTTAQIRKRYGLNKLLGDDVKKNRQNDKHHALDAICISYSRDFKYNKEKDCDEIEGFNTEYVKNIIDNIIPYPYANKKPFKGNIKPLETIYGKRIISGKACIVNRVSLSEIKPDAKKIKNIIDETIKNDLLEKLETKPAPKEWADLMQNYIHPKKKTKVKKVLMIVSEGTLEKDLNNRERIGEFVDFGCKGTMGQFKHSKGHKGQILYYDNKDNIKVMPIYANIKLSDVKNKIENMNCKLYMKGMMFYSGCLVEIPDNFMAGSVEHPKGIYKLRTIQSKNGAIMLENCNGIEILTSVKNLATAKFIKYKN